MSLESVDRELDRQLSTELLLDWLRHPVTKVIIVVVVAEIAYQAMVKYGLKLAGIRGVHDA